MVSGNRASPPSGVTIRSSLDEVPVEPSFKDSTDSLLVPRSHAIEVDLVSYTFDGNTTSLRPNHLATGRRGAFP